jgi:hypothetical protein
VLIPQVQPLFADLRLTLGDTGQVILDLLQIGGIALIIAALLSPLETLGWWAGWYGDRVEATVPPGTTEAPGPSTSPAATWCIWTALASQIHLFP